MNHTHYRFWPLPVLVLLVVAACSQPVEHEDHDAVVLAEDDFLAFYVWRANDIGYPDGHGGYLILVAADGSFRRVKIGDMLGGAPLWWGDVLHIADEDADYLLDTAGLRRFPNEKIFVRDSGVVTEEGVLTFYNVGFVDGSYHADVVRVTDEGVAVSEVREGKYAKAAVCGDEIYAIVQDWEGQLARKVDGGPRRRQHSALVRVDPEAGAEPQVLGWTPARSLGETSTSLACDGRHLRYRNAYSPSRDDRTDAEVVVSWDLDTGEYTEVPLREPDGPLLSARRHGFLEEALGTEHGHVVNAEGQVEWVGGDGVLYASDPATGVTHERFPIHPAVRYDEPWWNVSVEFLPDVVAVAYHQQNTKDFVYAEYDRPSGDKLRELALDDAVPPGYYLHRIAVRR
jgi:hypothetical protein